MGLFSSKKGGPTSPPSTVPKKPSLFERYRNGQPGEPPKKTSEARGSTSAGETQRDDSKSAHEHTDLDLSKKTNQLEDTPAPLGEGFGVAAAPSRSKGLGKSTVPGGTGLMGYLSR
ncbi:hypothetical protein CC79DRAFT_1327158 [Sarocladium strictum]